MSNQVVSAPASEREDLLNELQQFAFRGIPNASAIAAKQPEKPNLDQEGPSRHDRWAYKSRSTYVDFYFTPLLLNLFYDFSPLLSTSSQVDSIDDCDKSEAASLDNKCSSDPSQVCSQYQSEAC